MCLHVYELQKKKTQKLNAYTVIHLLQMRQSEKAVVSQAYLQKCNVSCIH